MATLTLTRGVGGEHSVGSGAKQIIGFDPLTGCVYPGVVNRVVSGARESALVGGSSFQVLDGTVSHVQSATPLV